MRRLALALLIAATLGPAAAQQPGKVYRVGWVGPGNERCAWPASDTAKGTPWEGLPLNFSEIALRLALAELGLVDGRNVAFERRCYQSHAQLDGIAADLASRNLDAVFTWTVAATLAVKNVLRVPLVFIGSSDPVRDGLVESIARPGGNVTGISNQADEVAEKRAQLVRELLPQARTAAVVYARADEDLIFAPYARKQSPAERVGFQVRRVPVDGWPDIEAALLAMRQQRPDVLSVLFTAWLRNHAEALLGLATAEGLPTICSFTVFVEQGCLMSYSVNSTDLHRQAGRLLGKILLGANPAETPVEQPIKFELWLNLKTAAAIGLAVPPAILARADRVIE